MIYITFLFRNLFSQLVGRHRDSHEHIFHRVRPYLIGPCYPFHVFYRRVPYVISFYHVPLCLDLFLDLDRDCGQVYDDLVRLFPLGDHHEFAF